MNNQSIIYKEHYLAFRNELISQKIGLINYEDIDLILKNNPDFIKKNKKNQELLDSIRETEVKVNKFISAFNVARFFINLLDKFNESSSNT